MNYFFKSKLLMSKIDTINIILLFKWDHTLSYNDNLAPVRS